MLIFFSNDSYKNRAKIAELSFFLVSTFRAKTKPKLLNSQFLSRTFGAKIEPKPLNSQFLERRVAYQVYVRGGGSVR